MDTTASYKEINDFYDNFILKDAAIFSETAFAIFGSTKKLSMDAPHYFNENSSYRYLATML